MMSQLVKFLHHDLVHHGYQYKKGLNILDQDWNPSGECEPGGLYYTNHANVGHWCYLYTLVADVILPPGTRVHAERCGTKWKCDKLILSNVRSIADFFIEHPELCLLAVQQNGLALRFVDTQTPEICLAAVVQNGLALAFVRNQTHDICLAAVKENGLALQFVKEQTHKLCSTAVERNEFAWQFVKDITMEINRFALFRY